MTAPSNESLIAAAAEAHRLLDHPFYRRWECGGLSGGELSRYAEQYRHIERCLPEVLASTVEAMAEGPARDLVATNLADELGAPRPHAELFEDFAVAVRGEPGAPMSPATKRLCDLYRHSVASGPVAALAVVGAYEVQAADVARTKAASLREHYGLDDRGVGFWDVHSTMESDHARWTLDALEMLDASDEIVRSFAQASAEAWWEFLSERDAEQPV